MIGGSSERPGATDSREAVFSLLSMRVTTNSRTILRCTTSQYHLSSPIRKQEWVLMTTQTFLSRSRLSD